MGSPKGLNSSKGVGPIWDSEYAGPWGLYPVGYKNGLGEQFETIRVKR